MQLIDELLHKELSKIVETSNSKVVLWYDSGGEFRKTVNQLNFPDLTIIHDKSPLEIKLSLEKGLLEQNTSIIIYFPLAAKKNVLIDFYNSFLPRFDESIEVLLEKTGFRIPGSAQKRIKIRKSLPELAFESIGKGKRFWEDRFKISPDETIIGDFDLLLDNFLKEPEEVQKRLQAEKKLDPFVRLIHRHFGIKLDELQLPEWHDEFLFRLALVKFVSQLNQVDRQDFPLEKLIPPKTSHAKCLQWLDNIVNHTEMGEILRTSLKNIENKYSTLRDFGKTNQLSYIHEPIFQGLVKIALSQFETTFESITSKTEILEFVSAHIDYLKHMALGFWGRTIEFPEWKVAWLGFQVIQKANDALEQLRSLNSATEFVTTYISEWWSVDQLFRRFRQTIALPYLESVVIDWTERIYREYLEKTNSNFSESLKSLKKWHIEGFSSQDDFWSSNIGKRPKEAIMFIDALRFEIAKEIDSHLKNGELETSLVAMHACIPTTTRIGMARLLSPDDFEVKLSQDGELSLFVGDQSLGTKKDRIKFLRSRDGIRYLPDIRDLPRQLKKKRIRPAAKPLVLFDTTLDTTSEAIGLDVYNFISNWFDNLVTTIRFLFKKGFETVHVVTDHGFLLQEDVKDHAKVTLPEDTEILLKKAKKRYTLTAQPPGGPYIAFPIENSELYMVTPFGISCFSTPGKYEFMHGGLSLQEIVIPHLKITRKGAGVAEKMKIGLSVQPKISSRIFKVKVFPDQKLDKFIPSAVEGRNVKVYVMLDDKRVSIEIADFIETETMEKTIRLQPIALTRGQKLQIIAQDVDTLEILDKKTIELYTDLEEGL